MTNYIADTHTLLWYSTQPKRLGAQATSALAEVATGNANLIVPVIIIAELIFVLESGRVRADFSIVLEQFSIECTHEHPHPGPPPRFKPKRRGGDDVYDP